MSAAYPASVFTPGLTFPHQSSTYIRSQLLDAISIASVTMSVDIALPDTMNQVWVGHPWPSKSEFLLRIQLDNWWSGHFYCCVYDRLEILPFTNISLVMDCVGGGTLEKLFSEVPLSGFKRRWCLPQVIDAAAQPHGGATRGGHSGGLYASTPHLHLKSFRPLVIQIQSGVRGLPI